MESQVEKLQSFSAPAVGSSAAEDMNYLFQFSPIPSLVLSASCRITRASNSFLSAWGINPPESCVGLQLEELLEAKLRPGFRNDAASLGALIDSAISSREERTSAPLHVGYISLWSTRVVPIFNADELVALCLEWREQPNPTSLLDGEFITTGLGTDEAFRILVQAVKDYAIFLLDTKGNIATWNIGAELHKGYKKEEIIGKHFSIFYGKEDLAINKPQMELEICLREGRVEDEGWRYRKDGTRFWANVIITAVYKEGVHVGFGKVTRDLTERKASEARLISVYEESERLKSEFLANMSHEIRTPMHGMLSACSLLLDTPLTDKQRDIASIMDESGKVLLQVINDILDYSKLASGSFSINTDIVGVTSIITSVVRSVQSTLQPAVYFELFLAADLPKSAQGDPLRFRQIVQNIIGNAAKFTEKGSIRVRASLQAEDRDSYVVMTEVTDTGIGISEDAARGLFTPFTQFDLTTTKRYKGTGLGLSIAKSLAELMGGQIGYRPSPERHGSIFWFTVRLKKIKSLDQIQQWDRKVANEELAVRTGELSAAEKQKKLSEAAPIKTLLLVEDNLINQKVMVGMLRQLGFKNVELAGNGSEAVNIVRAKPAAFDLVLMDISMPILDGNQASARIRDSNILVPIIAMTAYALKGDKERCLEHGMDDYVSKPVDRKRLISVLYTWLCERGDYRKYTGEAALKYTPTLNTKLDRDAFAKDIRDVALFRVPKAASPSGETTQPPLAGDANKQPEVLDGDSNISSPQAAISARLSSAAEVIGRKLSTAAESVAQTLSGDGANASGGASDGASARKRSSSSVEKEDDVGEEARRHSDPSTANPAPDVNGA
jgi:osomolarity two-component system sensor histidine kinase TcsA